MSTLVHALADTENENGFRWSEEERRPHQFDWLPQEEYLKRMIVDTVLALEKNNKKRKKYKLDLARHYKVFFFKLRMKASH